MAFKMKSSPTKLFNFGFHRRNLKKFIKEGEEVGIINPKYDPNTGLSTVGGKRSGKGSGKGSKARGWDFVY